MKRKKVKHPPAVQAVLDYYRMDVRGREAVLTDKLKRALLAQAVLDVMLARYEVELDRERPTSPNVYVDLYHQVEVLVGLRDEPVTEAKP